MRGLASQLKAAHAESRDSEGLFLSSLTGIHPEARPSAARFAQLLAATVTCLLVIACANLAGLLLARNTTRHKEIAMRLALGAGRGRIVRQLLFESVLLAVCGGVVGLLFASWGNVLLASYYGTEIEGVRHSDALTIDPAALLLTMAVATATGIAFGLLPAVIASRTAVIPALKRDSASQGFRRSRLGAAGGLGLLLTAIGLYAVLALAVGQRTREIGVRMALGARVPSILSLIVREGIALSLAGLALGLASAIVLSRLLTRFLYGITPNDPVTYGVATVLVGGVALAACAIPAWRAARVDPMVALRYE
jgi:ABC-type antimicrobial peptide transport system permease subunit